MSLAGLSKGVDEGLFGGSNGFRGVSVEGVDTCFPGNRRSPRFRNSSKGAHPDMRNL